MEDIMGFRRASPMREEAITFLENEGVPQERGEALDDDILLDEGELVGREDFLGITPLKPAAECLIGCFVSEVLVNVGSFL